MILRRFLCIVSLSALVFSSCTKEPGTTGGSGTTPIDPTPVIPPFDINTINDTYGALAPFTQYLKWGPHNVHDPAIIKVDDWYYSYSTDVGYGIDVRPGLQIRKSKDLVQWYYVGWVFNGLPAQGVSFIKQNGIDPFNSLWAPCIVKAGNEFRLYYSLSSSKPRLSVIGLATASNPEGPWTERGPVVVSKDDNTRQTNAIDPSVIITSSGEHWMYYGSGWDGIYVLQLNPSNGLALSATDIGKRVANRGFTNGRYNGNIEGADIIYNEALKKYYLFIAYDWLETKYNVRVMRGEKPTGPFYDYKGVDANTDIDHGPMIIAPYRFGGHSGWQGVSHSAAFSDGNGQYFIAHQGRPGIDKYFMNMHVRKLFWTTDGWPVASPERYAWEKDSTIAKSDLTGDWEQIVLGYRIVPGYAAEQNIPDFQEAVTIGLSANGTINNNASNTWTYTAPWLELKWSNGYTDKVFVQHGRDWENRKSTIIFTGLNNDGTAIWGKKK